MLGMYFIFIYTFTDVFLATLVSALRMDPRCIHAECQNNEKSLALPPKIRAKGHHFKLFFISAGTSGTISRSSAVNSLLL